MQRKALLSTVEAGRARKNTGTTKSTCKAKRRLNTWDIQTTQESGIGVYPTEKGDVSEQQREREMEMSKYRIKGWSEFQHYKDRRPPWIKLHRTLLDNREYHMLSDGAGKALPLIWIMASDFGGELPDNKTAAFRLRKAEDEYHAVISELVERGFVEQAEQVASELLASCYTTSKQGSNHATPSASKLLQTVKEDAIPETEGETEKRQSERESETPATVGSDGTGTPDQKPKTEPPPTPPPSKPIEPDDHPLVIMAQKVRGCRPEYSAMTVSGILRHLCYFSGHPHLARTVDEWCAHHANAVEGYQMPLRSLAKALGAMAAAPTRARAFGE
jgi:hypothetical protein